MTLDILANLKHKLWLEFTSLGLLTIIGIMVFGVIPSLLMTENITIQIISLVFLIGLSFSIFKIIQLLANGFIVEWIIKKILK